MEPTEKNFAFEFQDGTSVFVDLYESDKGRLAVISRDASNPFNHGPEPQIWRDEIADKICKEFGCGPKDYQHIEQDGQHWQNVPLDRGENGDIKIQDGTRPSQVNEQSVQEQVTLHLEKSVGQELVDTPDWANHLQQSSAWSHDR